MSLRTAPLAEPTALSGCPAGREEPSQPVARFERWLECSVLPSLGGERGPRPLPTASHAPGWANAGPASCRPPPRAPSRPAPHRTAGTSSARLRERVSGCTEAPPTCNGVQETPSSAPPCDASRATGPFTSDPPRFHPAVRAEAGWRATRQTRHARCVSAGATGWTGAARPPPVLAELSGPFAAGTRFQMLSSSGAHAPPAARRWRLRPTAWRRRVRPSWRPVAWRRRIPPPPPPSHPTARRRCVRTQRLGGGRPHVRPSRRLRAVAAPILSCAVRVSTDTTMFSFDERLLNH